MWPHVYSTWAFLYPTSAEQAFRVNDDHAVNGVHSCPHPYGAGLLRGRGFEDLASKEEGVVQRVRLALSGVPKDGDHLEQLTGVATQPAHKLLLILHLRITTTSALLARQRHTGTCGTQGWDAAAYLHLLPLVHQKEAVNLL